MADLVKRDKWYQQLIEDLKLLSFQGIVHTKHAIGKRINQDELKFGKPKYGNHTIENLAKDLDVSRSELFCCVQFAKKYPDLEKSDSVRQLSWRKITHQLLPESVHFSSESAEWTTPQIIINKTLELFGEIDLDPCSNPDFPNIPAKNHFTEKDDGLSKDWFGKVYMNPPYGRGLKKWIFYLCEQFETGNVEEAIALVPSRTDTDWFKQFRECPRCFVFGRLRFANSENSAPFPSMVVYLGGNFNKFKMIFSSIGDIYGLI